MSTAATTSQHPYSPENLQAWRQVGDPLADAVAVHLQRQRPAQMLAAVETLAVEGNQACQEFLHTVQQVPDWVDWSIIEHARQVSLAFAGVRNVALLAGSLLEGYMGSKAVHVLVATGRLRQDVTRRLFETAQMSHNLHQRDALRPGGIAHRTMLEVRLLHAMVRKQLHARGWDTALYDEPINQEDMAFTIIEFNYLAVRGMERLGAALSDEDRAALHHLWRYAAWLHGVCPQLLTESVDQEVELYQRICAHQYAPNHESRQMALAVLQGMAGQPPLPLPVEALYELARLCLGDTVADIYQLPRDRRWLPLIRAYQARNRAATLAHYRLPGHAALSRTVNFQWMRSLLQQRLGTDSERRAFRHIA